MLILEVILFLTIIYLVMASSYQFYLALSYFVTKKPHSKESSHRNSFAILVPSHNEELLISKFCESVLSVDYSKEQYDVFIIADNCDDRTEEICSNYPVKVLTRHDKVKTGKGYALEWALEKIDIESYDSVIVLDADTTVKNTILTELNKMLNNGDQAIQCYIEVPNSEESWFTQLISLSRTINDLLYHYSKYKLGLSSYLMGTGMCFSTQLLKKMKWSAFTLSEDWEYYAKLIDKGYKVAFSVDSVILQQESCSLKQATSQRLRWASGRFYVVKNLGFNLLFKGILKRDLVMADASLALLFPNWSLQVNMIILTLLFSLLLPSSLFATIMISISFGLITLQSIIVLIGVYLTSNPLASFKAVLFAPVFLVWKFGIDLLCLTKIYKGKTWVRTKRHISK